MQIPALFKPVNLGAGFGDEYDFSFSASAGPDWMPTFDVINPDQDFTINDIFDVPFVDIFDEPIMPVEMVQKIALENPGKEVEAIAKTLQVTAPDWTKQFKTTDELIRAAAGLYNTTKAVITGKPIPDVIRYPNNQTINKPTQNSLSNTNMLLIGGVALAAILLLRKK